MHTSYEIGGVVRQGTNEFAFHQYDVAIRQHLEYLSRGQEQSVGAYIVSCILFTCIENAD